jgi:hypothetical protein
MKTYEKNNPIPFHTLFEKYLKSSNKKEKSVGFLDGIGKIIGALGSSAIVFSAFLYLNGRYYADGYFSAMGIPEYLIKFSVQEYAAAIWHIAILYSTIMLIAGCLVGLLFLYMVKLIGSINIIQRIIRWVKKFFLKKFLPVNNKEKQNGITSFTWWFQILLLFGFFLFCMLIVLGDSFRYVRTIGENNGKQYILNNANTLDILSVNSLPLDGQRIMVSQSAEENIKYYSYDNFRLLTLNNDKYYLFKEIDPLTCKPKQVYIIDASAIQQVVLQPAESLAGVCAVLKK